MSNKDSDNCEKVNTPITEQQFNDICELIETTVLGTDKACLQLGISPTSLRKYMRIVGEIAELRYARAKESQIEIILDKITELQEQCLDEVRYIEDPKRCNAIQSAYREQIRHYEWIASKLKPKRYGDKIDITSNGLSVTRDINIALPSKLSAGTKVTDNSTQDSTVSL